MSEAAIGLIGVVAGVILAGVFEYTLRRRTEARESRAAARLLRDAFLLVIDSLRPTDAASEVYDFHFALDEWREHRAILARELTNREWQDVAAAAQLLWGVDGCRPGEVGRPTSHALNSGFTAEELEAGVLKLLEDRLLEAAVSLERPAAGRRYSRQVKREREQLRNE